MIESIPVKHTLTQINNELFKKIVQLQGLKLKILQEKDFLLHYYF